MKVYVTGPAFTPHARAFLLALMQRLEEYGFEAVGVLGATAASSEALCEAQRAAMRTAHAMLVLLDGTQVDDGAACQMGWFYGLMCSDATKRGILGLVSDERALRRATHGFGLNLFVLGVLENRGRVCTCIEDVLQQLETWEKELPSAET